MFWILFKIHRQSLHLRHKSYWAASLLSHWVSSRFINSIAGFPVASLLFPTLLLPHVRRYLKRVEEGDDFKVIVVDDKGNPRVAGANGDLMTVEQLVAEMKTKDEYAGGFKGTGASGSGAGGSGVTSTGDQILITRADGRNPAKYQAAKERAAKEGKTLGWAD